MSDLARIGVSISSKLLGDFDRLIEEMGYQNRSEALRDLIRERMVQREWEGGDKETVGVVSLVYDHHKREIADQLVDFQHHHTESIVASLHVHLDQQNCLEVLIVRGVGRQIKVIADKLIGTKGVKHGKLLMATAGRDIV
jgi:CopG family nickel-responsive transcriptional regulator